MVRWLNREIRGLQGFQDSTARDKSLQRTPKTPPKRYPKKQSRNFKLKNTAFPKNLSKNGNVGGLQVPQDLSGLLNILLVVVAFSPDF